MSLNLLFLQGIFLNMPLKYGMGYMTYFRFCVQAIGQLFSDIFEQLLIIAPDQYYIFNFRKKYWRKKLMAGSELKTIGKFSVIKNPSKIFIGRSVINNFTTIDATLGEGIWIGNDVFIGLYVLIVCYDHCFSDSVKPIAEQGYTSGKIVIEDDVWIGSHVVITNNVTIGKGSVIGAGAVVTHDIPPYSVAVGVPAKVIRTRIISSSE